LLASTANTVDWFNALTIEMHIPSASTGPVTHAAPLLGPKSVDSAMTALVAIGIPKGKIVIGVPFYGFGWAGVASGAVGASALSYAPSSYGPDADGVEDYRVLRQRFMNSSNGFVRTFDASAGVASYYSTEKKEFWTLDDADAVVAKKTYAATGGYKGVLGWYLDADSVGSGLLMVLTGVAPGVLRKRGSEWDEGYQDDADGSWHRVRRSVQGLWKRLFGEGQKHCTSRRLPC
jgi:chitinase